MITYREKKLSFETLNAKLCRSKLNAGYIDTRMETALYFIKLFWLIQK